MANIAFKRGIHSKLPTTAVDGCFYLTTDTNRLYVGQGTELVELNKSITEVSSVANLPEANVADGQFFYAVAENVLCIRRENAWQQINADHNDTIQTTGVTVGTSGTTDAVKVSGSVSQKKTDKYGTETNLSAITFDGPTVKGANGAKVEQANNTITVTGDTYSKATETQETEGKITLKSALGQDDIVVAKAGSNVTIAKDGTISSSYDDTTIKTKSETVKASSTGEYTITVEDSKSNASITKFTPKIKLANETTVYPFVEDVSTLPVYSKTEIDNKLNGLDAMTYKGTVGTDGTVTTLPTSGVKTGDTYLCISEVTGSGKTGKSGDLFIATGTETNGVIPSANIVWTYVPSGDDAAIDTQYKVVTSANSFDIQDTINNSSIGKITWTGDVQAVTSSGGVTVSHKAVTRNDSAVTTVEGEVTSITAVTDVTTSATGHVTDVKKSKFNIQDIDTTYTLSGENSLANNKGTFKVSLKDKNNNTNTATFEIESEGLTLTEKTNGVGINLVWGSF